MIRTINDLQEMDIVLQKDGRVLWVLRNDYTYKLQTFNIDMWGQRELDHYNPNFTYGKDVQYFVPHRDNKLDIVAVCRPASKWKALQLMRYYEMAKQDVKQNPSKENEEYLAEQFEAFKWQYTPAYTRNGMETACSQNLI